MSLPPMTPANTDRKVVQRLERLEKAFKEFAAATGTLGSATVKGDLQVKDGGSISVADGGNIFLSADGKFLVVGDDSYVQILEDSFSIGTIANGAFTRPAMIMRPDGFLAAISDTQYAVFKVDEVDGAAIITSSVGIVRLPYQTTSSSANTRILLDGTIQLVNSSLRYKADPAEAVIDVDDVLQLQGRTWIDKATMERLAEAGDEADIPRDVGFIAEELDALPSMRQFVDYDDQGRPDAIQYDRLPVALLELAKAQQAKLLDQQKQLDRLAARLDALESTHSESEEVS